MIFLFFNESNTASFVWALLLIYSVSFEEEKPVEGPRKSHMI
jgi:hypothetical protein